MNRTLSCRLALVVLLALSDAAYAVAAPPPPAMAAGAARHAGRPVSWSLALAQSWAALRAAVLPAARPGKPLSDVRSTGMPFPSISGSGPTMDPLGSPL